jgi:hypothetical protein
VCGVVLYLHITPWPKKKLAGCSGNDTEMICVWRHADKGVAAIKNGNDLPLQLKNAHFMKRNLCWLYFCLFDKNYWSCRNVY